jgi:hypothetical protein
MQNYNHEKTKPIHIKKNLSTSIKINSHTSEYSLKQNCFDPSKSSPPNEFIIKLNMRINKYHIDNRLINLVTE